MDILAKALLLFLTALPVRAAAPRLALDPGPYAVGFQVIQTSDAGRNRFPACAQLPGRPMQIHLWYPAAGDGGKAMAFGEYLALLAQEQRCGQPAADDVSHGGNLFLAHAAELGGDRARLQDGLASLSQAVTGARRDARPAAGRFPLVLFPAYRAPALESVMSEFLASHGLVVASVALRGTLDAEPEITLAGIETLADDLAFVVDEARRLPMVDGSRLAAMGVGFNASGAFAYLMRNADVDALVSLDGGIPTQFEDAMLRRSPYFDVTAIRAPILAIWAPHPNVDPALLDVYRYAPRGIVYFPKMREFYFLNFGMIEGVIPNVIGTPAHDPRPGFERAARLVAGFLGAAFDGSAPAWMAAAAATQDPDAAASFRRAVPAPPALAELKKLVDDEGVGALRTLAARLRHEDPEPIAADRFVALNTWLADRDADFSRRRELALLRVELFPGSSRAHFTAAQVARQRGEKDLARKHYLESLRLLDGDGDPSLDESVRERIRRVANEELAKS